MICGFDLAKGKDVQTWLVQCRKCQVVIIRGERSHPTNDPAVAQVAEAACRDHAAVCPGAAPQTVIRGRVTED